MAIKISSYTQIAIGVIFLFTIYLYYLTQQDQVIIAEVKFSTSVADYHLGECKFTEASNWNAGIGEFIISESATPNLFNGHQGFRIIRGFTPRYRVIIHIGPSTGDYFLCEY